MIQVIIHESRLQTIKINVCGFRPNGAEHLNEVKVWLIDTLGWDIFVRGYYSVCISVISFLNAEVKLV